MYTKYSIEFLKKISERSIKPQSANLDKLDKIFLKKYI